MEKIEDGTLPITDDEAESVTGGESLEVQAWRRVATGEGRPVQIGNQGPIHGPFGTYRGWVAGKCPSCEEGEALFASSHDSFYVGECEVTRYFNCKCYICRATWSELFLLNTNNTYSGRIITTDPRLFRQY
jgi:hypothetical protein